MTSEIDLEALRALAEKATPGPWTVSEPAGDLGYAPAGSAQVRAEAVRSSGCLVPFGIVHHTDAAFIAALNPAVVLALIARLERAEGALERMVELTDCGHTGPYGIATCPVCSCEDEIRDAARDVLAKRGAK